MKKSLITLTAVVFTSAILHGQNIGINSSGSTPNASALLDVDASPNNNKGMLIPRVTQAERIAMNPLPVAAQGLTVYQTDGTQGFYYNISTTTTPNWAFLVPDANPIGSIIAWHKSFTNTPALPNGWVECNGQTLSDADSPYNGQVIPNLNGDARFLRGSSTSGTNQSDAFQGHVHGISSSTLGAYYSSNGGAGGNAKISWTATVSNSILEFTITNPASDGTNGTPRTANETRPINMSVVYIMRVK
ncbi:MAG: hypothetical protein AABZ32_08340 [Bacteroidota bacterium]